MPLRFPSRIRAPCLLCHECGRYSIATCFGFHGRFPSPRSAVSPLGDELPVRSLFLHDFASFRRRTLHSAFYLGAVNMQVHHPVVFVEQVLGAAILLELVLVRVGDEGRGL